MNHIKSMAAEELFSSGLYFVSLNGEALKKNYIPTVNSGTLQSYLSDIGQRGMRIFTYYNISDNPFPAYSGKVIYAIAINNNSVSGGIRLIGTDGSGAVLSATIPYVVPKE